MGDNKSSGKRAVNRHQVQSKDAAGRQERAIEKVTRQAGSKQIRTEVVDWDAYCRAHPDGLDDFDPSED